MKWNLKQKGKSSTVGYIFLLGIFVAGLFSAVFFSVSDVFQITYKAQNIIYSTKKSASLDEAAPEEKVLKPIRIPTPDSVKAIYMTQCVAGTPSFRERLVRLVETTEINSIVIDIKDYSGRLGFIPKNPKLKDSLSTECYAPDMEEFVRRLNEKGIYVIARITVFQDPYYADKHPDLAVQKESDRSVWYDYKGLSFIDVGALEMWDYIVAIGKDAYDIGFDELNFDYIRFPSDGNMEDIYFPFSEDRIVKNPSTGKAEILEEFFAYLHKQLKGYSSEGEFSTHEEQGSTAGPVLSADLFGMVTTNTDDLNIGQVLERAEPYFDYIAPMVYPSHYPPGFNGWVNPNEYVYEVVKFSMDSAVKRLKATTTTVQTLTNEPISTTTPILYAKSYVDPNKLRPWLQDFDYGGNYGVEEVKMQIQATYDAGLNSWMLWNSANIYTKDALLAASTTPGE
ncbi:hypothetical protein IIC45_01440 [Patescibacteria group bacterium]|nr:hypothetical protein [Patescibacteria group bacterium]